MTTFQAYGPRNQSTATTAMIRQQLADLRRTMRREAIVEEATSRLAARMNVRPAEAAAHLARLSHDSGVDLLDVARGVEQPVAEEVTPVEPPEWVRMVLASLHTSAAYLTPVTDPTGRVVDFTVEAVNEIAVDVTGRGPEFLRGKRMVTATPGVVRSGILDDYLRVYETGEPLLRGPMEYVEVRDHLLWPATVTVRAVRVGDGVLASWRTLDEDERLVSGWERAQRIAELGWAEWNLANGRAIWTSQMYELFGRSQEQGPMPLEELPDAVVPEDVPSVDE